MSATYTDVSCQVSLIQKKIKHSCFQRWKEWSQPLSSSAYHPKSIFQYFCLPFGISALLFIFAGLMWTLRKAKARAVYSDQPAATVSQKDVLIKAQQDGHSRRTHKPGTPRLPASLTCDGRSLWKKSRGGKGGKQSVIQYAPTQLLEILLTGF